MNYSKTLMFSAAILLAILLIAPQNAISSPYNSVKDAQWIRYGTSPLIQTGPPGSWDSAHIVVDSVIIVNNVYHLFYWGSSEGTTAWNEGHATSPDGIHWVKDVRNPIMANALGFYLVYEDNLFKAWYTDTSGWYTIRYATSVDGSNWQIGWPYPVLQTTPGSWDSNGLRAGPILHNASGYSMWYCGTPDDVTWSTGLAVSQDGINWTKYPGNPVISNDPNVQWRSQRILPMSILKTSEELIMWFLGSDLITQRIGVAISIDGKAWTASNLPVFDIGPFGSWDSLSLSYSAILPIDNSLWMWYSGTNATFHYQIGLATTATTPSPPTDVMARPGISNVTLTWNPPLDDGGLSIIQYQVFRRDTSQNEVFLTSVHSTTFIDTHLNNGTRYYYTIVAINGLGPSQFSEEVNAKTPTLPSAPTWITTVPGNNLINMTWSIPDDGGDDISHYCLYRGETVNSMTLLANVSGTSYSDHGVMNGVLFHYKVSAINGLGAGQPSAVLSTSARTIPGSIIDAISLDGDGIVSVSWIQPNDDGGSNITGYKIYRGTSSNSESYLITVNSTSFVDRNVTNGQTYYYRVSATNAAGDGPLSIELRSLPSKPIDMMLIALAALIVVAIAAGVMIILFITKHNRK
jgi:fibronectin type 3 domain-containing protein/predicted GH43/DUF377 family glycosyl hydrolase